VAGRSKNEDREASATGSARIGAGRLPILGQAAPPPERRDAARNRARILDAARALLRERPIGDICMDELARSAGVGKGTLYRRFADRASLCRALLDDEALRLQERVLSGLGLPPDAPWMERLERLLAALFEFTADHAALLSEAQAFARGGGRFEHPAHVWQRDTVARYLSGARRRGEIGPLDPEVTAELILSGLDPELLQWLTQRGVSKERLGAEFRRFWRLGVLGGERR
jgi:AcrR family transcriptional regulator